MNRKRPARNKPPPIGKFFVHDHLDNPHSPCPHYRLYQVHQCRQFDPHNPEVSIHMNQVIPGHSSTRPLSHDETIILGANPPEKPAHALTCQLFLPNSIQTSINLQGKFQSPADRSFWTEQTFWLIENLHTDLLNLHFMYTIPEVNSNIRPKPALLPIDLQEEYQNQFETTLEAIINYKNSLLDKINRNPEISEWTLNLFQSTKLPTYVLSPAPTNHLIIHQEKNNTLTLTGL